MRKKTARCEWCEKVIEPTGRGRPRKYCCHSCRQRAYEQRNNVTGTSIPADAVIMSPERATEFRDSLFELRCAAEDIHTAATEHADHDDIAALCEELVELASKIERLRVSSTK